MRYLSCLFLSVCIFVTFSTHALADEGYVLPYPSFMPGHPFYKFFSYFEKVKEIWSFGSFAKFTYNLSMADKKLVEAKTLFEYKQYLFASYALSQYKEYLISAHRSLRNAVLERKNISQKQKILKNAIAKHNTVLEKVKSEEPESFIWQPEKSQPQVIKIRELINQAIAAGEAEKE